MVRKFIKILKWTALVLLVIITVLSISYWDLVTYGLRQARGQHYIIRNAKPVEVYLTDPTFPDSLKAKLRLIEQVRKFAIDSLGLRDTRNYKTLFDQKGQPIMWVVTACEPFQLQEKEWRFPVLGAVPYKGFFNQGLALAEQKKLEEQGYDVTIRNPGGWSTLGWFTDPILSEMLYRSDGDLASLIIHEMAHATIFVKDSVEFNENLASFIGDRGAEKFLSSVYGFESEVYKSFLREDRDFLRYIDHILRGCDYLDSVYAVIVDKPHAEKIRIKEQSIREIVRSQDTLALEVLTNPFQKNNNELPNNAYFMSFRRYQSRQDELWEEWQEVYKGDLRAYIYDQRERHPFL